MDVPAPPHSPPQAAPAPPAGGKPVAALALGILGLVGGFVALPLLGAVLAITLASLAFQDIDAGRLAPARRGLAVAGMVCGIVALALWVPVILAVAVTQA